MAAPQQTNNAQGAQLTGPLGDIQTATKSDSTNETYPFRAIYVGTSQDVKLTTMQGTAITLPSLAAGIWHPVRGQRIWSTGTGAAAVLIGY